MGGQEQSAGILLYRFRADQAQVLLVHPGGPYWAHKDLGAWSLPKGLFETGEAPLAAARREFLEETGFAVDGDFIALGEVRQPSGKIIHAWALEGDLDVDKLHSNTFSLEWPKGSGQWQAIPEVDRGAWFELGTAYSKISPGQTPFLDRLRAQLGSRPRAGS